MANMVTLQAWRLENTSGEHFKQYTVFQGGGHCLFFNSRIGSTWQNQTPKNVTDAAGKAMSQLHAKRRGGYDDVWSGDVTIPDDWARDPQTYVRQIQDMAESAYRTGDRRPSAETPVDSGTVPTPLANLVDDCRSVVSKMAVNPDQAIADLAHVVAARDAVVDELGLVDGYLDTLRAMIGATSPA